MSDEAEELEFETFGPFSSTRMMCGLWLESERIREPSHIRLFFIARGAVAAGLSQMGQPVNRQTVSAAMRRIIADICLYDPRYRHMVP